jgi:hypothetical protein
MGKRNKKRAHIKGWHDTPRHSKSKNLNEFAALVEEEGAESTCPFFISSNCIDVVIHVDRIPPTKKRERFQHLSTVSLSSMVGSASPDGSDSEEVGFFLDSEPGPAPALAPAPARKLPADNKYSKQYQKHYKRIIQDDSVYIDKDDDQSSISSSDDLEGLEALSHWAKQDIMTLNQKAVNKEMEDYEMLDQTTFDDIFESSSEEEEEQEEMEDENFLDASMMSQYVPEFMKNSKSLGIIFIDALVNIFQVTRG